MLGKLLNSPRPLVMGILNVTPDSFSDGGQFLDENKALGQIEAMLENGADIIDIGGESTRPGASEVTVEEELSRVIPLVQAAKSLGAIVSVDTSKPQVMVEALACGVDIINDVRALQEEGAVDVLSKSNAYVCLMHMQGQPRTMQKNPQYDNVLNEVQLMLRNRIAECEANGIDTKRIIIDPGFGFGKTLEHNIELMRQLDKLHELGCPILVGVSRKTMIGEMLQEEIPERLIGSVVAASYAAIKGVKILRVHDVKETVQALKIISAFEHK